MGCSYFALIALYAPGAMIDRPAHLAEPGDESAMAVVADFLAKASAQEAPTALELEPLVTPASLETQARAKPPQSGR